MATILSNHGLSYRKFAVCHCANCGHKETVWYDKWPVLHQTAYSIMLHLERRGWTELYVRKLSGRNSAPYGENGCLLHFWFCSSCTASADK